MISILITSKLDALLKPLLIFIEKSLEENAKIIFGASTLGAHRSFSQENVAIGNTGQIFFFLTEVL